MMTGVSVAILSFFRHRETFLFILKQQRLPSWKHTVGLTETQVMAASVCDSN